MINKPRPVVFTKEGLEKLQKEHDEVKLSRPAVVEDLSKARAMGDLSENGYYKAAKQKLGEVDRKLRFLSSLIRRAHVVEKTDAEEVGIGSTVTLKGEIGEVTYHIVGDYEADPSNKMISSHSPIGKAVIGKRVHDKIEITTPSGKKLFHIVTIT